MSFPSKLSEYNSLRYWECRYDEDYDDNYEWFQSAYDRFLEKCTSLLNNQDIALIIGCGNSKLGLDLSTKLADCLCIDFASNVIMKMNRKYQLQVTYLIMDMIFLTFRSDVFDTVIDKGKPLCY